MGGVREPHTSFTGDDVGPGAARRIPARVPLRPYVDRCRSRHIVFVTVDTLSLLMVIILSREKRKKERNAKSLYRSKKLRFFFARMIFEIQREKLFFNKNIFVNRNKYNKKASIRFLCDITINVVGISRGARFQWCRSCMRIDAVAGRQIAALFPGPCPHVQRWPSARSARRCVRSRSNLAVTPTLCSRKRDRRARICSGPRCLRGRPEERIQATFPQKKKNGEQARGRDQRSHIFHRLERDTRVTTV